MVSDNNQASDMALRIVDVYCLGKHFLSRLALGGEHTPEAKKEAALILDAVWEFCQIYVAERLELIRKIGDELGEAGDLTGPEIYKIAEPFGKPSLLNIEPEIKKILERLENEQRQEKIDMMRLAFASSNN
jgi:hypothetical protein